VALAGVVCGFSQQATDALWVAAYPSYLTWRWGRAVVWAQCRAAARCDKRSASTCALPQLAAGEVCAAAALAARLFLPTPSTHRHRFSSKTAGQPLSAPRSPRRLPVCMDAPTTPGSRVQVCMWHTHSRLPCQCTRLGGHVACGCSSGCTAARAAATHLLGKGGDVLLLLLVEAHVLKHKHLRRSRGHHRGSGAVACTGGPLTPGGQCRWLLLNISPAHSCSCIAAGTHQHPSDTPALPARPSYCAAAASVQRNGATAMQQSQTATAGEGEHAQSQKAGRA
jgi:hypothetical protein